MIICTYYSLDQQWSLTKNMTLVNRDGDWMYKDLKWSLPNEGNEGFIVDRESNKVLGIDGENCEGSKVMLQTRENPENPDQKWKRSSTDENGFFTLNNVNSGLFLNNGHHYVWEPEPFPTIESTYFFLTM